MMRYFLIKLFLEYITYVGVFLILNGLNTIIGYALLNVKEKNWKLKLFGLIRESWYFTIINIGILFTTFLLITSDDKTIVNDLISSYKFYPIVIQVFLYVTIPISSSVFKNRFMNKKKFKNVGKFSLVFLAVLSKIIGKTDEKYIDIINTFKEKDDKSEEYNIKKISENAFDNNESTDKELCQFIISKRKNIPIKEIVCDRVNCKQYEICKYSRINREDHNE